MTAIPDTLRLRHRLSEGSKPSAKKSRPESASVDRHGFFLACAFVSSNKKMTIKHQGIMAGVILVAMSLYPLHLFLRWGDQLNYNQDGANMNQIQIGVLQYAQDNQDCLPPMNELGAFHNAVLSYVGTPSVFSDYDNTSVLYLPNPNLSGKRVSSIRRLTVLLYESAPAKIDNSRWVVFLPHLPGSPPFGDPDFTDKKLIKEKYWQKLKVAEGISD